MQFLPDDVVAHTLNKLHFHGFLKNAAGSCKKFNRLASGIKTNRRAAVAKGDPDDWLPAIPREAKRIDLLPADDQSRADADSTVTK